MNASAEAQKKTSIGKNKKINHYFSNFRLQPNKSWFTLMRTQSQEEDFNWLESMKKIMLALWF